MTREIAPEIAAVLAPAETTTDHSRDKARAHARVVAQLWAEIENVVGSWSGEEDEVSRFQRLLSCAKSIRRL